MNSPVNEICVIGAGAVGGLLAARLSARGRKVGVIEQGDQLRAIQQIGLQITGPGAADNLQVSIPATDRFDTGPKDIIVLAVKANQLPNIATRLRPLMHEDTMVVTVQNGVPWWYFQRHGGDLDGRLLERVDPGGIINKHIDSSRIIGCVVYPAMTVVRPGVIHLVEGCRMPVGELDNSDSMRVRELSGMLVDAGFKSPVLDDLRGEIWLKLWGALAFNPVSMLTGATLEDICRNMATRYLIASMMQEAQRIAYALGIAFRVPLERRIDGAAKVGPHKTSTLQDLESGQQTEIDALLGAVIELGQLTGVDTPHLDSIYAACQLLEQTTLGSQYAATL
jgi:2-dehydropantoate 2-reductase